MKPNILFTRSVLKIYCYHMSILAINKKFLFLDFFKKHVYTAHEPLLIFEIVQRKKKIVLVNQRPSSAMAPSMCSTAARERSSFDGYCLWLGAESDQKLAGVMSIK